MNGRSGASNPNSVIGVKSECQQQTTQNVMTVATTSRSTVATTSSRSTVATTSRSTVATTRSGVNSYRATQTAPNVATTSTKTVCATATVVTAPETNAEDLQSQYGRFGWPENNADVYYGIPYLLRNSMKYFPVEMIVTRPPIRMYLSCLHRDVNSYYLSLIKYATKAECSLFNEINAWHCDHALSTLSFTTGTLTLILDTDAYQLWEFLDTCYKKLTGCTTVISNKIGFLQFNFKTGYIPFVMRNGAVCMPLMALYNFPNINSVPVEYISGWDLQYLKFCCLYQGTWKGSASLLPVVTLSALYPYLPDRTNYVTCWPLPQHNLMLIPVPVRLVAAGNRSEQPTDSRNGPSTSETSAADTGHATRQCDTRKRCGETIAGTATIKLRRRNGIFQPSNASNEKVHGNADNIRKV